VLSSRRGALLPDPLPFAGEAFLSIRPRAIPISLRTPAWAYFVAHARRVELVPLIGTALRLVAS